MEIVCLQETKINQDEDFEENGYRFINIKCGEPAYGNGFLLSKNRKYHVHKHRKLFDTKAVLQLMFSIEQYSSE